jgi:hypothetical protein
MRLYPIIIDTLAVAEIENVTPATDNSEIRKESFCWVIVDYALEIAIRLFGILIDTVFCSALLPPFSCIVAESYDNNESFTGTQ